MAPAGRVARGRTAGRHSFAGEHGAEDAAEVRYWAGTTESENGHSQIRKVACIREL